MQGDRKDDNCLRRAWLLDSRRGYHARSCLARATPATAADEYTGEIVCFCFARTESFVRLSFSISKLGYTP